MSKHAEPPICLGTWPCHDPLGYLPLKHKRQTVIPRRPGLRLKPSNEKWSGDIVGQIRNYAGGCVYKRSHVRCKGVAFDDLKPARIDRRNLFERRDTSPVLLDCHHTPRSGIEQSSGQSTGARSHLYNVVIIQRAGRTGDTPRQIEIEQEILPERFLRGQPMPGNDLAKGRQRWTGHVADARWPAISAAIRMASMRLAGCAFPSPAMSSAVPWSGEVRTMGKPSVVFTPRSKSIVFKGMSA